MNLPMSLSNHLRMQLAAEVASSRRVIERVPDSMLHWAPHEKSMKALELATHVANLIAWGSMVSTTDELDFASEQMKNWSPPTSDTIEGVLEILDGHAEKLDAILEGMSDEELEKPWVMRSGDQIFSNEPKHFQLAKWVLSHQSHHRGQLTVYLRENDVPVPGIFGPSADEQVM